MYISNASRSDINLIYNDNETTTDQYQSRQGHYTIQVGHVLGQYVKIKLNAKNLVICELQVFEACRAGTYGDSCSPCGHCLHGNVSCDTVSGHCPVGCTAGFTGPTCHQACSDLTFGLNCSGTCHCYNNEQCNHTNGMCPNGCEVGYSGFNCSTDEDLLHTIQHSLTANMSTPVYNGMNASLAIDGSVGTLPDSCHCCSVTNANKSWWRLELGRMYPIRGVKLIGSSGNDTTKQNKKDKHKLHLSNGSHTVAKLGYPNSIPGKQYVFYWNLSNIVTSSITIKRTNELVICEIKVYEGDCSVGYYGTSCEHECHCADNKPCKRNSGTCPMPECKPGWREHACNEECPNNTFGANCSHACHCINESHCDHVNGTCDLGLCEPGWQGSACDRVSTYTAHDESTAPAVDGMVMALIVVAVIIVALVIVVILVLRRKGILKRANERAGFDDITILTKHVTRDISDDDIPVGGLLNPLVGVVDGTYTEDNNQVAPKRDEYLNCVAMGTCIKIPELWHFIKSNEAEDFKKLFEEYATVPEELQHGCVAGSEPINRPKNRYKRLYAYDHSRVRLLDLDPGQTDYINASYITGYEREKKFIASQGPQDAMLGDFWDMVAQQGATTIVMLTNLVENARNKCVKYWEEEQVKTFGHVTVEVMQTETFSNYVVRHLKTTYRQGPPSTVKQYHFTVWPDKDVPATCLSLVAFWREVMENQTSPDGPPIIVHCSAGVGRTGTFIALDYLYNQGRTEGAINPLDTLRLLRDQRVLMIQNRLQYVYLIKALAEAFYIGTESIPADIFQNIFDSLTQVDPTTKKSKLLVQFEMVQEFGNSFWDQPDSVYQNCATAVVVEDNSRLMNNNRNSQVTQDNGFIELPNYANENAFIVTASPDETKLSEFWSLIYDHNVKTVVMLTELSSPSFKPSCTLGDGNTENSILNIVVVEQKKFPFGNEITFTLSQEADVRRTVKQFQYTAWKDRNEVPGDILSLLEFLEEVQCWQPHLSKDQPVLVHCDNGLFRCAPICLLLNELQRLKQDNEHVNILETAMMMKKRNSGLIQSFAQYRFCYDAINIHLNSSAIYQNVLT